MEYLLQHIEVVAELYNIVETLGDEVDFFNEDPIFLFVGQCELDNIDYFSIRQALVNTKQREMLQLFDDLVDMTDKLLDPEIASIYRAM